MLLTIIAIAGYAVVIAGIFRAERSAKRFEEFMSDSENYPL